MIVLLGFLVSSGAIELALESLAGNLGLVAVVITVAFWIYHIFWWASGEEKKRLGVIFWLFILAAIFWSGFEQAGSSLNIFTAGLVNHSWA